MSTRATATLGLVSFALIVVGGLIEPLWDMPGTGASGGEIASFVERDRDGFLLAVFVFALGMGGFLAFAGGLWAWLRSRPLVPESLAAMFVLGAVSLCTVVFVGFAAMFVLAYRPASVADPRTLYDLCFGLLAISGVPTAVALGSYGWIVLGSGALPAWSAWVAVVGAASHVLIAASFFFSSGFFSLEGGVIVAIPTTMFLWLLAASVSLLRLPVEARPA